MSLGAPGELLILIPVYDDWTAVGMLLPEIDKALAAAHLTANVLLVDDGSTTERPGSWASCPGSIDRVDVLGLRRNVGHQRAIAIALAFVERNLAPQAVVVMDGDGEDAPADVPRLVACLVENGARAVVFAERTRRSESIVFRIFYALYRWVHLVLTGIPVRVGNFSAIPASALRRLVVVSELWNHYAAAVFKARLRRASISTERAARLDGKSRMNFVDLVAHGLSALSVHSDLIGVRLLAITMTLILILSCGGAVVLAIRLFTPLAIPGWASTVAGLLLVLLLQSGSLAALFAFLVLHARSQPTFIPARDYVFFIDPEASTVPVSRHAKHWQPHAGGAS